MRGANLIWSLILLTLSLASSASLVLSRPSYYTKSKVHHNLPPSSLSKLISSNSDTATSSNTPRIVGTSGGSLFIDELGRSRIFRGTNVVYKAFPFAPDIRPDAIPRYSFNQADVDILKNHATTVIRLGVMWPGVEPERGQYNLTYLETMKSIVKMCDDAGIYVLLDFHQDIFSEKFCGEGVPMFAAQPREGRVESQSISRSTTREYHRKRIARNTNSIYTKEPKLSRKHTKDSMITTDGLRDSFVSYWKLVAETFLPFKNILGYDLINEPWNGNVFKDPSLSNPLVANKKNLQPFYDILSEGIRSVDPNALIHFEPVTTIQKTVGFDRVPGGPDFASKSVFNFHYYKTVQKQYDIDQTIGFRVQQAAELGAGSFMGEFEMGWGEGSNVPDIREHSQAADRHFLSYTGWEYTDYIAITGTNNGIRDPITGEVRPDMGAVYSRPYATAIAGHPLAMEYIDETGTFTLTFVYNGNKDGHSVNVLTANGGKFKALVNGDEGVVRIFPEESGQESPSIGEEVSVVLIRV
ncbi:glycoside hydrolase superfamily [Obelidium mucronatum]|nr:glycoside hydrolase superfamily [Obelidium mucronatum]